MSRTVVILAACLLAAAWPAAATPVSFEPLSAPCVASQESEWLAGTPQHGHDIWRVSWAAPAAMRSGAALLSTGLTSVLQSEPQRRRPVAVEYSHGYEVRRKIHKWASIATVPLFVAEFAVGQSLYNATTSSGSKRGAHAALAGGIAGLFGVNRPWAALYNHSKTLVTVVTFAHLSGLLLGGGAAIVSDRAAIRFSRASRDQQHRHLGDLHETHRIVLVGLTITALTGLLMLGADVQTFLGSRVFWIKMTLVAMLMTNGIFILKAESMARLAPAAGWKWLRTTAYLSLALWFITVFLGTAMATLG